MLFQFPPIIEAGIAVGKYTPVFSSSGVPLGLARDAATGQFVGHAVGMIANGGVPLNPLIFPLQGIQMYQTHKGFQAVQGGLQAIQASVGVLQATTAVIGVGVAAGVALSAVNLYQTIKLKKAVEKLELTVEKGFIDLKKALKDQKGEIIEVIQEIGRDIKFEQHRLILVKAYGLFVKALDRLRSAIRLQDLSRRNAEIDAARGMLFEALADYTNPQLIEDTSAPGQLRRQECAWAIEQAIVTTYQMQGELSAVSERLSCLQNKIRTDAVGIINSCASQNELDFLFPEICRIRYHDLALLEYWHNQSEWMLSLSSNELLALQDADLSGLDVDSSLGQLETLTIDAVAPEQSLYQELQQKSHHHSLQDQLLFMMDFPLRREVELYISQQATLSGRKTLYLSNLQQASDLTVANLYWYFKSRNSASA